MTLYKDLETPPAMSDVLTAIAGKCVDNLDRDSWLASAGGPEILLRYKLSGGTLLHDLWEEWSKKKLNSSSQDRKMHELGGMLDLKFGDTEPSNIASRFGGNGRAKTGRINGTNIKTSTKALDLMLGTWSEDNRPFCISNACQSEISGNRITIASCCVQTHEKIKNFTFRKNEKISINPPPGMPTADFFKYMREQQQNLIIAVTPEQLMHWDEREFSASFSNLDRYLQRADEGAYNLIYLLKMPRTLIENEDWIRGEGRYRSEMLTLLARNNHKRWRKHVTWFIAGDPHAEGVNDIFRITPADHWEQKIEARFLKNQKPGRGFMCAHVATDDSIEKMASNMEFAWTPLFDSTNSSDVGSNAPQGLMPMPSLSDEIAMILSKFVACANGSTSIPRDWQKLTVEQYIGWAAKLLKYLK